jgi:hypothetical protein
VPPGRGALFSAMEAEADVSDVPPGCPLPRQSAISKSEIRRGGRCTPPPRLADVRANRVWNFQRFESQAECVQERAVRIAAADFHESDCQKNGQILLRVAQERLETTMAQRQPPSRMILA